MMRRVLPVALLALAAATACDSRAPFGDFERMRVQHKYDAYSKATGFANGMTMQAPPAHTVSLESAGDTGVMASGMVAGQPATSLPVAVTPELLALGKRSYGVFCAACHGSAGFGGSVVASNMVERRPPSLRSPAVRALPPGTIFRVATDGFGRMPPYDWQLSPRERWAVVAYVLRLQSAAPTDSVAMADSLRAASFATDSSGSSR